MKYFRANGKEWIDSENRDFINEKLKVVDGKYKISESTKITELKLPFYDDYCLVQLADQGWEKKSLRLYYLMGEDELVRLDGTSPPIHDVNKKEPITLSDENVLFYLTFFCFFVRGDEGPFLIIDGLDNPYLPMEESSEKSIIDMIKEIFRQPRAFGKSEKGQWRYSALVYYSNAIFGADFTIPPSGIVEMNNDSPIISNLTAKIDALIG